MDIPLPVISSMSSIPLPVSNMNNIPLPPGAIPAENIPLPSNASIPLPAEKVFITLLETRLRQEDSCLGDELLCRSCAMKFSKQLEYDLHLQSEAHQQFPVNESHNHELKLPW
ncbi:hypothetical protein DPMN_078248 [Dreissena polymorpha]|uniref:C2H2-type domain-containing protein n=1 Tax=Dreissena polymorpha TaxID=45954 RepID=A0A9D4BS00_DREPO|nr:hypothetical protein DPMN_078248 [Dreissena polymorpha]